MRHRSLSLRSHWLEFSHVVTKKAGKFHLVIYSGRNGNEFCIVFQTQSFKGKKEKKEKKKE